jgi:zinc ribbon protein
MSYRPPSNGFHPCVRCGADVADGAQFCPVCGAPQNVARATSRPSGTPWWVPAGIIAGGIAALGAGVLLAALLDGGPDSVAGDPSPSAGETASVTASSSAEPSDSAIPTPTVEPTPEPAPVIPNLGIAAVVTDGLTLRSQPNEGASAVRELGPDWRLFVIGAPTEADDLRWYRVATLPSPTCTEQCDLIGYVATPIQAIEDPWIQGVGVDCPISPMTNNDLGALAPLEALHCYGRNEIVVTGTIDDTIGGFEGPLAYSPEWLAHPFAPPYFRAAQGFSIGFRPHPDADLDPPEAEDVVRVTGHYEDPAATTCRVTIDPAFEGDENPPLPDPALVVLGCRATFVWTAYEVTAP